KSRSSTRAAIVANSGSHKPIHGITADAGIRLGVCQSCDRAVSRAFEDLFSFYRWSKRAFALAKDVINVGAIGIPVANVSLSPSVQCSSAMIRRIVRHELVVVVFDV